MDNLFTYLAKRIKGFFLPNVKITSHKTKMLIENDIQVTMRDGAVIKVNIYRPDDHESHPVIISFHPYGKDGLPKKTFLGYNPPFQYRLLRQTNKVSFSELTNWEAPDPDFWVGQGYVVINGDMRGCFKSRTATSGEFQPFSDQEGDDYYDLIEWAATQTWSTGKIGLCGVSYLALSQYRPAALQPPHLAAICAWEGFSDVYKDLARPGGIREDGFFAFWTGQVSPELREGQIKHVIRDEWWQMKVPELKNIEIPALICGSFSDQLLHTGGSFRAYKEISSKQKWLYTHRNGKWAEYYSDEALAMQLKFFDHFLKGVDNDFQATPSVRLEVREDRDTIYRVSWINTWPPENTQKKRLFLNSDNQLSEQAERDQSRHEFDIKDGKVEFNYVLPEDLEIIGSMQLNLHIEVMETNDVNIFAGIKKFHNGKEVFFEGSYGYGMDVVTKGFLKASLRGKDESFSQQLLLSGKEIVDVQLTLLPSATFFRKGDVLRLVLQGNALFNFNIPMSQLGKFEKTTQGKCSIYTGGNYQSYLQIPSIKA